MQQTSSSFEFGHSHTDDPVSLSEVISAMTFALDLTEGAVPGHALRCCLLGMRLAHAMGIPEGLRVSLYYALQLKDIGCSNNAARMTQIVGGDDRKVKAIAKLADWTKPHRMDLNTVKALWGNMLPEASIPRRAARFFRVGLTQHKNNREMIELRCERGADIMRQLEMGEIAAEAVKHLDEHWDGSGYPTGLIGREIPLLARIALVAQNLDVFATERGKMAALDVLRSRSGTWFDPQVVVAAQRLNASGSLWTHCGHEDPVDTTRKAVLTLDPGMDAMLGPERVDNICAAFAGVVDAKSPFTYRHSIGVADVAEEIARELKLPPDRVQLVRRAALLHDLGKLHVPNTILDKSGRLTPEEWGVVVQHPGLTKSILQRVSSFRELAEIAAEHHEKLDGSGYPQGLTGDQMSIEARLIGVADVYTALAEDRPYRAGLDPAIILGILSHDVPKKLDEMCFDALKSAVSRWQGAMPDKTETHTPDMPWSPNWGTAVDSAELRIAM